MKHLYRYPLLLLAAFGLLVLFFQGTANRGGPPASHSGAPGENSCARSGCHVGTPNTGPGNVSIQFTGGGVTSYTPGQTYSMTVTSTEAGTNIFGFQLTALNGSGNAAGNIVVTDAANTQTNSGGGKQYINHTFAGTNPSAAGSQSWSFDWTAPNSDVGPITFYASSVAADGGGSPANDNVYTSNLSISAAATPNQTLVVDSLSVDTACGGQEVVIYFNTPDTFSAGNLFTAQYSADGSSFQNLANTPGDTAGAYTLTATLPVGLPAGGNYRFRMISASPTVISNEVSLVVTAPPTATVSPIGPSGNNGVSVSGNFTAVEWFNLNDPGTSIGSGDTLPGPLPDGSYYAMLTGPGGCMGWSDTFDLGVISRTNANHLNFGVYPNPATDAVAITLPEGLGGPLSLQVLDLQGRVHLQRNLPAAHQLDLPLEQLPTGLYLLRVRQGARWGTSRLYIQR